VNHARVLGSTIACTIFVPGSTTVETCMVLAGGSGWRRSRVPT